MINNLSNCHHAGAPPGVLTLSILLLVAEDYLMDWAYGLDAVKIALSQGYELLMEALHRLFERVFPCLEEPTLRLTIESAANITQQELSWAQEFASVLCFDTMSPSVVPCSWIPPNHGPSTGGTGTEEGRSWTLNIEDKSSM